MRQIYFKNSQKLRQAVLTLPSNEGPQPCMYIGNNTITFIYLNYFTAMREMSEDVFKNISTCFCMNKIVIIKLVIIMGASALAQHYLLHVSLTILGWEILFFSFSKSPSKMDVCRKSSKKKNSMRFHQSTVYAGRSLFWSLIF